MENCLPVEPATPVPAILYTIQRKPLRSNHYSRGKYSQVSRRRNLEENLYMVQTPDSEDYLQSSQSFVRSLKSSADPPRENGPTKIQIARMGWDSRTLYVPRKAGLIMEWIFARFQKEKSRKGCVINVQLA
jgi:hypothetical protein